MLYKLFYTHNRSKDTGHFNAKSFRKCTLIERGGSHLEWTASLCIFSVPALWNSSPTAHHNDAILHSPMKTILCGSYFLLKVPVAVLLFMSLTVKVLTLTTTCECFFSLYYRILIQGGKTHPLIFIVGTNNFIEYFTKLSNSNIYILQILFYYFYYNTVYSVCCRYTSCNLKQKQGSNCLLSIRRN